MEVLLQEPLLTQGGHPAPTGKRQRVSILTCLEKSTTESMEIEKIFSPLMKAVLFCFFKSLGVERQTDGYPEACVSPSLDVNTSWLRFFFPLAPQMPHLLLPFSVLAEEKEEEKCSFLMHREGGTVGHDA